MTTAEIPYHSVDTNSRLPTRDPYHYPLIVGTHVFNHLRESIRCGVLPVNRTNNSMQISYITCFQEKNRITQHAFELKFDETVKFVGLNLHPIRNSFQEKHQTFPRAFLAASLQTLSTDKHPFFVQRGSIAFRNSISGM